MSQNTSATSSEYHKFQSQSSVNMKSMFLTGYLENIESVRHKLDSVPYENFANCCSKDTTIKEEYDLSKKENKMPIKKVRQT